MHRNGEAGWGWVLVLKEKSPRVQRCTQVSKTVRFPKPPQKKHFCNSTLLLLSPWSSWGEGFTFSSDIYITSPAAQRLTSIRCRRQPQKSENVISASAECVLNWAAFISYLPIALWLSLTSRTLHATLYTFWQNLLAWATAMQNILERDFFDQKIMLEYIKRKRSAIN